MILYGPYLGIVQEVHDGDTVNVKLDVGFDLTIYARVRVFGINSPELRTPEGKTAKAFAQTLLPVGAQVQVTSHGWDKYGGRVDGDIQFGEAFTRSFSGEMLASGNAVRFLA